MNTNNKIGIIALITLVVLGAIYFANKTPMSEPQAVDNSNAVVSSADQEAIEKVVTAFGTKLRNVPTVAPVNISGPALEEEYGPYVTSELLSRWKSDPSLALGRQTSSPWPESISIISVSKNADGSYEVEGNVIEVTLQDPKVPAAVYPVTLRLVNDGGIWKISSVARGAYAELPKRMMLIGKQSCLPHKDTTGPQTLECAIGFKTDSGENYGLDLNLLQSTEAAALINSGVRVQIEGVVVPTEALNTNIWQKYDMKGMISVTAAMKI